MEQFEANFGRYVLKYRWFIILLSVVLVMLAASGGKNLKFDTNYRVFFSDDNPQLKAFDKLEQTYTRNDNVLFVLTPKDGNVFTRETLAVVEAVTEKAWQIPYSIRVDSITNFQHTFAEGDDLVVQDLVSDAKNLSDEEIKQIRNTVNNEPLLAQRLISPSGHVTSVSVTIQLPGKDETKEVPEVVSFARAMADEIRQQAPNVEVRLSGMVLMNNAFSEASKNDITSLVPMSFLVMLIVLGVLLKGISTTFGIMLVIMMSIVSGMGLGGYIGFPLTPPSATAPTIILTVAIANSVHVLITFIYEMRKGAGKHDALVESLRVNLQPVFLASLTTAIGFLSMNFSEVPPFRHLGNFVAMGVGVSFLLSVTFLPALISLLPVRIKPQPNGKDTLMVKMGNFVVTQQNKLLISMGVIIVVLISFLPRNELNDIFVNYFDETTSFRQQSDYVNENLTGLYVLDYSLESGEESGISNPKFMHEAEAFANWYRMQPETRHVNIMTDIMKRLNKNMHGDNPDWYKVPDNRDLAAQYLLMYEMSLPYGLDLNNQININKSAVRMTVSIVTSSSNDIIALESRAQEWLRKNTTHIKNADGSGPTIMFANIGKRNIRSMLLGTTIALILISGILIFALRSLTTGLVSMIPNLVPAAMGFGLWGLFVGEVGLALSVVTTMTLGIVVDDTVHFLSKYLRARREHEYSAPQAVRYAFNHVGRALVTTSIVLVAGFLVLAQSHFELNAGMGLLTAVVIALALAADLLFLPPLLMKLEKKS
ncbi:MAG: MMPL family transporter [Gammaproteobacteria bacterium]